MNPQIRKPFNGNPPITFKFGEAPQWYLNQFGYPHNGIDWAMPVGEAVLAADDGLITWTDDIPDANGAGLIINHRWGNSLYWHLSRVIAKYDELAKKGDLIGLSGASGYATGPHLHFGIKVTGVLNPRMKNWANPMDYLEDYSVPIVQPSPQPKTYIIRPGDNLWKIAFKFYGDGTKWRPIWEANKSQIPDPGLIFPFRKIIIP